MRCPRRSSSARTAGGTPFSPQNGFLFNAPNLAQCSDPNALKCTARIYTALSYLNYRATDLDNISFRSEFYHDREGQRTGTATRCQPAPLRGWERPDGGTGARSRSSRSDPKARR